MLTTEILDQLRNKFDLNSEERIILYLKDHGMICNVKQIAEDLHMSPAQVKTNVRKCPYIEIQLKKLVLRAKGIKSRYEYVDPWLAPDTKSFVFSLLCQDFYQSKDNIFDQVIYFGKLKGIDTRQFRMSHQIFDNIKSEVKKYLAALYPERVNGDWTYFNRG